MDNLPLPTAPGFVIETVDDHEPSAIAGRDGSGTLGAGEPAEKGEPVAGIDPHSCGIDGINPTQIEGVTVAECPDGAVIAASLDREKRERDVDPGVVASFQLAARPVLEVFDDRVPKLGTFESSRASPGGVVIEADDASGKFGEAMGRQLAVGVEGADGDILGDAANGRLSHGGRSGCC